MEYCVVCGNPASPQNEDPAGIDSQSRAATFFVRILLELGNDFEEFLTTNKLLKWWSTCEQCNKSVEESLEIYKQFKDLAGILQRKQKEFVDILSCKKWNEDDRVSTRKRSRLSTEKDDVAIKLRQKLNAHVWETHTFDLIPTFPTVEEYCKEIVKDQVERDVQDVEGSVADDLIPETFDSCVIKEEEEVDSIRLEEHIQSSSSEGQGKKDNFNGDEELTHAKNDATDQNTPDTSSDDYHESDEESYTPPSKKSRKQTVGNRRSPKSRRNPHPLPNLEVNSSKGQFQCTTCNFKSKWSSSVRIHYRRIHLREFSSEPRKKPTLLPDLQKNPSTRKYPCPSCDFSSLRSFTVRIHYKRRHLKGPNPKKEPKPKKQQGRKASILPDLERDPVTNKFHCPSCNYSTNFPTCARGHYKRIHLNSPQDGKEDKNFGTRPDTGEYDYRFRRFPNLILPDLERNPVTKRFSCPSCDYTGTRKEIVRKHYKRVHLNQLEYACTWPDCGRKFSSKGNWNCHMDRHKKTPRFQCPECPLKFYAPNPLVRHRQMDHEGGRVNKPFICEQCGKAFSNRDYLQNHKSHKHPTSAGGEGGVGKVSQVNGRKTAALKQVTCHVCGKAMCAGSLNVHLRNVHKDTSVKGKHDCSECHLTFLTKETLDVHLYSRHRIGEPIKTRVKSKSTTYKWRCDVVGCREWFREEEKFKSHMEEIHGPERNKPGQWACQYCGRRFFLKVKLDYHELVHRNTETRPFVCQVCEKGYPTHNHLRYHLSNTHKLPVENRRGIKQS